MNAASTAPGSPPEDSGRILVVDDDALNRELLRDHLELKGHCVIQAEDGHVALRAAVEQRPDVILLDLMMPDIDGIEVCRRLKADPNTRPIPVLMVTVQTDRDIRLAAIEAGADDFLNKPVDFAEVMLRVRNALLVKRSYDRIQESCVELARAQLMQQRLMQMLVHDLRAPLTVVRGMLLLLRDRTADKLGEDELDMLETALNSSEVINVMSGSLLSAQRLEHGEMALNYSRCDLLQLARDTIHPWQRLFAGREWRLSHDVPSLSAVCDKEIVARIIANLVKNACEFTEPDGSIEIELRREGNLVEVSCRDDGCGIAPADQARVFDMFYQVPGRRRGSGIGLAFCRRAVEAHGGEMRLESEPGAGSTFTFTLPQGGSSSLSGPRVSQRFGP